MKKELNIILLILFILSLFPLKTSCSEHISSDTKYIIYIDVNDLTLSLLNKNTKELVKQYPVAVGKTSTPSPLGQWLITSKALKDDPFGGYWLGLNAPWDTFGIHGTSDPSSIGSLASNGCIRMFNNNIKELFNLVSYDTQVIIEGGPNWFFSPYVRKIKPTDKGTDVFNVQKALKNIGYYDPMPDGIYGYDLEMAIEQYRIDSNIPGSSIIDEELLNSLGLFKFE